VALKVFAPNGDTKEVTGTVDIGAAKASPNLIDLVLELSDGTREVLNKKVVVQNVETGEVVWDPRRIPDKVWVGPNLRTLLTKKDLAWLDRHPHWPNVLELEDNPVDNGEGADGLQP
jgi:hypothetical protein